MDHIYSNCATHISSVTTSKDILSDHNYIHCVYTNDNLKIMPTYKLKRNYSLLTKHNLQQYFHHNTEIQEAFHFDDSNTIAEIIINQINIIIN